MSRGTHRRRRHHVDIPSAGQTILSFVLRPVEEEGPWPLTRVLSALGEFDVERVGVARALGDRHGVPLVHSQELRWRGHDVTLEARHGRDGVDELTLEMPPWDEVVDRVDEAEVWRFVDATAAGADARFGSIGDGEPPEMELPDSPDQLRAQLRRHLALLVPDWTADDVVAAGAAVDRELALSGLLVVSA